MNIPVRIPLDIDPDDAWQQLRDQCEEEFIDWQRADYDRREFTDFGNWLANKARWNRPNIYERALAWNERLPDPELVALSVNHRRFLRENRRENRK
jgi:hypothetical protein